MGRHNVVQKTECHNKTIWLITPNMEISEGSTHELVYMIRRTGAHVPYKTRPKGAADIWIYRRLQSHANMEIDETQYPEWIHKLYDEKTTKFRSLTTADWDAVSGGSESKDFDMHVEVVINKKTGLSAPLYSASYLASHEARRMTATKTKTPRDKKKTNGRKRAKPNDTSPPSSPPGPSDIQKIAMKSTKSMKLSEIEADALIRSVLTHEQMNAVIKRAKKKELKKIKISNHT